MELDTTAVVGRLNLPLRPGPTERPSSYNISRLGLAPSPVAPSPAPASAPEARAPKALPVAVAEPAAASPALATGPTSRPETAAPACPRRKTSFALPADLLDQVRDRAATTGTYQYAVVSQALRWFFRRQASGPSALGACVRRILQRLVGRSGPKAR